MGIEPYPNHIPLWKLWDFLSDRRVLTAPECAHFLYCEECYAGLQACIRSQSWEPIDHPLHDLEVNTAKHF